MAAKKRKYKYTQARQVGGDDGYCWTIFVNGRERINGLTRREVAYYRDRWEDEEADKAAARKDKTLTAGERSDFLHDGVVYAPGPDGVS